MKLHLGVTWKGEDVGDYYIATIEFREMKFLTSIQFNVSTEFSALVEAAL
jgi:hypothetical protein